MNLLVDSPGTASAPLPLAIEADGPGNPRGALEWLEGERGRFEHALLERGALLFRGWGLDGLEDFARFVTAFEGSEERFGYSGGASPRQALGGRGLYSSTEYPPSMSLSLHNELSYAGLWPRRLFFFCLVAPLEGGATTLADSRRILEALDPAVMDEFRRKDLLYIRNLSPLKGSLYSWQEAFETDDPAEAEARCRATGAEFEWRDGGLLRMRQRLPATRLHPETGEEVWFNQADGFHPSALDPATYAEQLALCGSEEHFRLNVRFGDGTRIDPAALAHIRAVLAAQTVPHRWREGDVVVLDNMLAAHGRAPFEGPRKIALAMT